MNKPHLLSLLIFSTLLAGNSFANAEKMTYEKAIESDKNTFHRNSVPLQETIDNWNTYVKAPNESSGGSAKIERQYTLIWKAPTTAGLTSGNITLSQSFREFDEIVSIGSMDDGRYVQHYRFTPAEYDAAVVLRNGYATLFERDSVSWYGVFTSDTYFTTKGENSRLYEIYGVKFGTGGAQKVCTAGETQSKYTYCTGAYEQTCEPGEERQTCSALGFWGAWQTIMPPSCITGSQQCR
ncbi:hypothetical protein OCF84_22070 (plasmid) [Shewanella xiamenensis]|uniref:hypothetical protein n=1 Tax=Shewanella xiamenensis TaxID=332186 RepID=UPI0024AE752D|nr:hypothetical protein [Shewanella xiamenensis]WHF58031.1 hypothetical protein OCF84_22070 [Shewanella xiamenensis]